ncbi:hypothetical protein J7L05_08670 [bacterium]|nr:hypothetical protein [bacterium]
MTNIHELKEQIAEIRKDGVPDFDGIEDNVLGICSTCKHSAGCAYLRNHTEPIFHCNEFETIEAETATTAVAEPRTESEQADTENFKGLCVNCEKRHECKINKPESGIWHCEEYA